MAGPSDLELQAATILYATLGAEFGMIVRTNDPLRAKQLFYSFRKQLGDPTLAAIVIRVSPINPESELWLLNSSGGQDAQNHG